MKVPYPWGPGRVKCLRAAAQDCWEIPAWVCTLLNTCTHIYLQTSVEWCALCGGRAWGWIGIGHC